MKQDDEVIEVRCYVRLPTKDDHVEVPIGQDLPQPALVVDDEYLREMAPDNDTFLSATMRR